MKEDIAQQSWRLMADCHNQLGESPVWVAQDQALWWVDIERPRIWRCYWPNGPVQQWEPPLRVTAMAPRRQGGFVAATERGFAFFDDPQGPYHLIGNPESGQWRNRFNDGAVDRHGYFWAGSMDILESAPSGHLYRLAPNGQWQRADSGYHVANGPAFSPDGRTLYHNDSLLRTTYAYGLDDTGAIIDKRIFLQFSKEDGAPDGMAVDTGGDVWISFWEGACVRRFSAQGLLQAQIHLPVSRPTSLAFGGPERDWLFITTAEEPTATALEEPKRYAGALLAVQAGVQGLELLPFAG